MKYHPLDIIEIKGSYSNAPKSSTETVLPLGQYIQAIKIIQQGNIYRLIVKSKLPSAEIFKNSAFAELLQHIRHIPIINTINPRLIRERALSRAREISFFEA